MRALPERPWFAAAAVAVATLVAGALLISSFINAGDRALLCSLSGFHSRSASSAPDLSAALLHYATTTVVPQQSRDEIRVSYDVLRARSPCNFLVFGLGRDSLMWASFNAGGTTLFLEEDPKWVQSVLRDAPGLHARTVRYPTRLDQADALLRSYRSEPDCVAASPLLKGNRRCRLALADLPDEVYDRDWDLIMIDAPRGYFDAAPGRMGAIYSAGVMARGRRAGGTTDIFLHDVDRRVERAFAEEFLCKKNRVGGTGRLWHFRIPPVNRTDGEAFC